MNKNLLSIYDEVAKCSRCGFCQPTCPVYRATGFEGSVARGHNLLIRDVIEGRRKLGIELERNISQCLLCRACTFNCFPAVRTADNVIRARQELLEEQGQPALQQFIFHRLLPNPGELTKYLRFLSWGKRAGLASLVRMLSVFAWFGPKLSHAQELLPQLPAHFLRDRLIKKDMTRTQPAKDKGEVIYFIGCGINFALPEVGEGTLDLLNSNGFLVKVLEHNCCGLPPYVYGDISAARLLARQNIMTFEAEKDKLIVTDCASCSSFLKDYPILFAGDNEWEERAKMFSSRVRDINELDCHGLRPRNDVIASVAKQSQKGNSYTIELKGLSQKTPEKIVTYHDPCHLSRFQMLTQEPRTLIKSLPGIKFVELPESDWCCGGAGTYNLTHPDISIKILGRKMENLKKTNADYLVTSCPACIIQLAYGVRKWNLPTKVLHISQIST